MKGLLFFALALVISFLSAASLNFVVFSIIFPFIKTYPQIRGYAVFGIFMHILPWLLEIIGAFLIASSGYFLLHKKVLSFVGLFFVALCTAWPAGSYASVVKIVGWPSVFEFSLNFWIAFVHIGLVTFNLIPWIYALAFFSFALLIYFLSVWQRIK